RISLVGLLPFLTPLGVRLFFLPLFSSKPEFGFPFLAQSCFIRLEASFFFAHLRKNKSYSNIPKIVLKNYQTAKFYLFWLRIRQFYFIFTSTKPANQNLSRCIKHSIIYLI